MFKHYFCFLLKLYMAERENVAERGDDAGGSTVGK